MNTFLEPPQAIDDPTALPMRQVRHRLLTPSEVQEIWALLTPVSLPCKTQAIHITLKQGPEVSHYGWVIQLGQYPRTGIP